MIAGCILIGVIFGIIGVIVVACLYVDSDDEERYHDEQ